MAEELHSDGAVTVSGLDCGEYRMLAGRAEQLVEEFHRKRIADETEAYLAKQSVDRKLGEFQKLHEDALGLAKAYRPPKRVDPRFSASEDGVRKAMDSINRFRAAYGAGIFEKMSLKAYAREAADYIHSAGPWFQEHAKALTADGDRKLAEMAEARRQDERKAQNEMAALVQMAEAQCEQGGAATLPWDSSAWQSHAGPLPAAPMVRLSETAFHQIGGRAFRFPILARVPGEHLVVSPQARDRSGCDLVTPVLLRALKAVPPGKLRILFIDATTLGDAFASVLGIGDLSEEVIHTKVWTGEQDIRARLEEATARVSLIIQKYLKGDYATIDAYNEQAGEIAEPYQLIAINDFPNGLDRRSVEMVQSLAEVGPRAGVSLLLIPGPSTGDDRDRIAKGIYESISLWMWPIERGAFVEPGYGGGLKAPDWCLDLVRLQEMAQALDQELLWTVNRAGKHSWHLDLAHEPAPPEGVLDAVLVDVGREYESGSRVEVTLDRVWGLMADASELAEPPTVSEPDTWWTGTSTDGLRIALGRHGSRGVCALELNSRLQSSALLVGRPGSGKSNLLHSVIMSATALYSPAELQLYMLDFREAVEFAGYAVERLPHARAVALEADREFGLAVLRAVVEEMERRGALFRQTGGEQASIVTYRQATGETVPRILLVVDEFHRIFDREDAVAADAAHALDTIIRLGRGFGVHCLLASQTLMGMTALGRHTLNQVQVRIALQCLEEDARLVLSDGNNGPALLTRPGEGIFNAAAGREEHNQPFQAPLIPEAERMAFLREMRARADRDGLPGGPVVYQRNETVPLSSLPPRSGTGLGLRLGRPVSLAPQLEVSLTRESSRNLLVVGRNETLVAEMLAGSLADLHSLAPDELVVEVFDFGGGDNPVVAVSGRCGYRLRRRREFADGIAELKRTVEARADGALASPSVLIVLNGLTRARDLDPEDYGEEAQRLAADLHAVVRDGPEVGIHTVVSCDSAANLGRRLDRRIQRELGIRVAFAMSSEDSQQILDSEVACGLRDREAVLVDLDASRTVKFQPLTMG